MLQHQRRSARASENVCGPRFIVFHWSHERFTRNYQGVSREKWLKVNHARAPIRTGPVTRTLEPVDVQRHASRARDLKTRKEPMSSIWHLPVQKPKSVIWSGLRTTTSTPNIILG